MLSEADSHKCQTCKKAITPRLLYCTFDVNPYWSLRNHRNIFRFQPTTRTILKISRQPCGLRLLDSTPRWTTCMGRMTSGAAVCRLAVIVDWAPMCYHGHGAFLFPVFFCNIRCDFLGRGSWCNFLFLHYCGLPVIICVTVVMGQWHSCFNTVVLKLFWINAPWTSWQASQHPLDLIISLPTPLVLKNKMNKRPPKATKHRHLSTVSFSVTF